MVRKCSKKPTTSRFRKLVGQSLRQKPVEKADKGDQMGCSAKKKKKKKKIFLSSLKFCNFDDIKANSSWTLKGIVKKVAPDCFAQ